MRTREEHGLDQVLVQKLSTDSTMGQHYESHGFSQAQIKYVYNGGGMGGRKRVGSRPVSLK